MPFNTVVEQVPHKSFYLHFVQIREKTLDAVNKQVDHKLFICCIKMRLSIFRIQFDLEEITFN
jgi:hypothetical protein